AVEKAKKPTLALYVDAPVAERVWPPEFFAKVADFAIEKLDASVIVISSPQGRDRALRIQKAAQSTKGLEIFSDLSLSQLVEVIATASLLISNDTGPMHVGPAVGVLTLGLFSVGFPEHFRPTGIHDRFLRANPIEEIRVQDVIEVMVEMWAKVDRG